MSDQETPFTGPEQPDGRGDIQPEPRERPPARKPGQGEPKQEPYGEPGSYTESRPPPREYPGETRYTGEEARQRPPMEPGMYPGPEPQQRPYTGPEGYAGPGPQPAYGGQYAQPGRRRRGPWFWALLVLIILVVLCGGCGLILTVLGYSFIGTSSSVSETRSFTVGGRPTLVINNDVGSINVRPGGSDNTISIKATKRSIGFGSNPSNVQVLYDQSAGSNTVTINIQRNNSIGFLGGTSVDFDVTLPGGADLQLKSNTGSIDVSGISGQMTLTSNTGSVSATQSTLTSSSTLSTNTGTVTFSGSIGSSGAYQFTTNTGSVNVTLPSTASFTVTANTDTGSITTDFPGLNVTKPDSTHSQFQGSVGSSPQASLTLKTNTGSITLNRGS